MWLEKISRRIIACKRCPRLRRYCEKIARQKRRAYQDWDYWGKPVPGFGDARAELLIIGLAPAAHGANRTGRMFTGDRSGDFLYAALFRAGYASQPVSVRRDDKLLLKNCFITASVRCAPPENKPTLRELANCQPFLEEEIMLLSRVRVVLALGKIAFDRYLKLLKEQGQVLPMKKYSFKHGDFYRLPQPLPLLAASYHPSQQNTFTGRLTPLMLDQVLGRITAFLENKD